MKRSAISLLAALLLVSSACSLAPEYKRPDLPVPSSLPPAENTESSEKNNGGKKTWHEFFTDENLKKIMSIALENNRDLRIAALNIEKAQGIYRIKRAELIPPVDLSASGGRQRILARNGETETSSQYSVGVGILNYELDFFGRLRNLKKSALEQYLATEEAHRSAHNSLIAEVTAAYLTLAADRERLALAGETLKSQEEAFRLMERRLSAGTASELELKQAEVRLAASRADIARFTSIAAQDLNALTLLAGKHLPEELLPSKLPDELTSKEETWTPISSHVLLERPDVIEAERNLKALNANIGVARTAFFPRISLTATAGIASRELSDLFSDGKGIWAFTPKLSIPLFDRGGGKGNLKAATAERDIAVARYEKTIQTAFREVADALARRQTIGDELASHKALSEAALRSLELSEARYEKGIDSYLDVLDLQRSLYSAKQGLINVRLSELLNVSTIYKTLGGGSEAGNKKENPLLP